MANRIGIDCLSVFDMPPVAFIELTAQLGCRYISLGSTPMGYNFEGYPAFDLRRDRRLRGEALAALEHNGISIASAEGFPILPGTDLRDRAGDLEIMRELGATSVNTYSMDPDRGRSFDQLAALAEMAAELDMASTLEFIPSLQIADLEEALAAVRHTGRSSCRLMVDCLHLIRSGGSVTELASIPPARIGYGQICDAPLVPVIEDYAEEAGLERLVPGDGELPLAEFVAALADDIPIGIEVPRCSLARSGVGPLERLAPCVEATRRLLGQP